MVLNRIMGQRNAVSLELDEDFVQSALEEAKQLQPGPTEAAPPLSETWAAQLTGSLKEMELTRERLLADKAAIDKDLEQNEIVIESIRAALNSIRNPKAYDAVQPETVTKKAKG
jgi:small-conductance mechanosensitive channel